MVQVKQGIKSPLIRTSRQLTAWKKTFKDAEEMAVTKNEPMKRRIIFFHSDEDRCLFLSLKTPWPIILR
jgi:hypothetical protein